MSGSRPRRHVIAACAILSAVSACSAVDAYSGRAVQYNLEAEQSQDQTILLNVIRASKRRPLEFTSLQSVSGTASMSGGGNLLFPFGRQPGPNALSLTESVSGGPTFTVAILDTQEFFQGILKPIPLQVVDFYVQARYPRPMLFNMLIDRIVIKQEDPASGRSTVLVLPNYAASDRELDGFHFVMNYLLNLGLSTQARDKAVSYGPALTAAEVGHLDMITGATAAGLEVKAASWCELTEEERRNAILRFGLRPAADLDAALGRTLADIAAACAAGKVTPAPLRAINGAPTVLYRVQKSEKSFEFCFAPWMLASGGASPASAIDREMDEARKRLTTSALACGRAAAAPEPPAAPGANTGMQAQSRSPGLRLEVDMWAGLREKLAELPQRSDEHFDDGQPLTVELAPRTTEGVIYYLGEVVRRQTEAEFGQPRRQIMIPYGQSTRPVPLEGCDRAPDVDKSHCEPLFVIDTGDGSGAFISVTYDGTRYAIPSDKGAAGRTYQVLDLVTQLLGLNKSAKDLPAASIFTITGAP
jgi:hypothetical protein